MRILHLDSGREWRGGQQQVFWLACGLAQLKAEQHLLVQQKSPLALKLAEANISFNRQSYSSELDPLALFRLCGFLRKFRPEIVHAHDSRTLGLAVLAKHLLPGWKLVAARRVTFSIRSNKLWKWKYIEGVDRIIAVSQQVRQQLLHDGIPSTHVSVVYDGFPGMPAPEMEQREMARRHWNIPQGKILVGAIGNFTEEKGHEYLVRAWPEINRVLPSSYLMLVGDGPLRSNLENLSKQLGVNGSIRFAGFQQDLTKVWPAIDFFIYPSLREGLGSTLLAAMNYRIPVCASNAGGIPEVVIDGQTGLLFPPADARALASILVGLVQNPQQASRLVQNAAAHVEKNFRLDQMVAGTWKIYRELLGAQEREEPFRDH
jgi:glycosyltransferase involved in cell wall biosynthesis